MLQVIFFYIFVWWFKKLENRKALIARSILASIFGLIYLVTAIVLFTNEDSEEKGLYVIGIIMLIPTILFIIRAISDIAKICSDKAKASNTGTAFAKNSVSVDERKYKSLIEKCGIKFFIKYYKQIKRLPLRDVAISENFSPSEREERLLAAKKIIDLNLSEYALSEILKTYGDILDSAEIEQAKTLLEEIKAEKVNTELEYKPWLRNKSNGDATNKPSAEGEYRGYMSEYDTNQHSGDSDKTQRQANPTSSQNKDTWDD